MHQTPPDVTLVTPPCLSLKHCLPSLLSPLKIICQELHASRGHPNVSSLQSCQLTTSTASLPLGLGSPPPSLFLSYYETTCSDNPLRRAYSFTYCMLLQLCINTSVPASLLYLLASEPSILLVLKSAKYRGATDTQSTQNKD